MIRKLILSFVFCVVLCGSSLLPLGMAGAQSFDRNNVADDATFNNVSAMDATEIDQFLNGFSGSCISINNGFSAVEPTGYNPSSQGFLYGGLVSAGRVIYAAAEAYDINPQVILTTLQKEQSLVTGSGGCSTLAYTAATGYGCPDSGGSYNYSGVDLYAIHGVVVSKVNGTCVNTSLKAGFSQQVIRAAWLLKFAEERSEGNINWAIISGSWDNSDDLQSCYGGPMTPGTWQICPGQPAAYYSGYTTIDGTSVLMENGATAALYWYTPHLSGNTNFFNIFSDWFGSPTSSCHAVSNIGGAISGPNIIAFQAKSKPAATNYALILQNNTGSECVEAHILTGPGGTSWLAHISTGMRASDPSLGQILAFKLPGNRADTLLYMSYGGGANNVSVHEFSPTLSLLPGYYDAATNLPPVTPGSGTFVAGDFFDRGYDQVAYVDYDGSSGKVELHFFDPSLHTAVGYDDIVTDLSPVTAASGTFVSGDFLGRGYDQLAFVEYDGGSGMVEIHLFDPTLHNAIGYDDIITNIPGLSSPNGGTFIGGDFLGRGYDQLAYVDYAGSSGMVEIHLFNQTLKDGIGYFDHPTIVAPINPSE